MGRSRTVQARLRVAMPPLPDLLRSVLAGGALLVTMAGLALVTAGLTIDAVGDGMILGGVLTTVVGLLLGWGAVRFASADGVVAGTIGLLASVAFMISKAVDTPEMILIGLALLVLTALRAVWGRPAAEPGRTKSEMPA